MKRLKGFFSEKRIVFLIRWWSVGAVYFFIGWGTNLSMTSAIDFVFFLGLSIGIFNMLVVNPIVKHMYGVSSGRIYGETTLLYKVRYRLFEILKAMMIVVILLFTYNLINMLAVELLLRDSNQVFLPGEPITFGLMYMAVHGLLTGLISNVTGRMNEQKKVSAL